MNRFLLVFCLALCVWSSRAVAAESSAEKPIEITADTGLEWNRDSKTYVARGHAVASQNGFSVEADVLTAEYGDEKSGSDSITRLIAEGNVKLVSGENTGFGDRAVYDTLSGKAVLSGKDVKVTGPNLNIAAKDHIDYYAKEGRIVATGRPLVTQVDNTLEADTITAWIWMSSDTPPSNQNGQSLKKAEAEGEVVIHSGEEISTSQKPSITGIKTQPNSSELSKLPEAPIGLKVIKLNWI
jgi:lipopolysaccharide export system protein LptA